MAQTLIAGNWKMNGLRSHGLDLARNLAEAVKGPEMPGGVEILLCPPATLLQACVQATALSPALVYGGQDCHAEADGAHTGDISAEMLADAGAGYVIVGHSERRQDHGEDDALVRAKAEAAQRAGLVPIICVGERLEDREAGRAEQVVGDQLRHSLPAGEAFVVAYEPVWAIGTGRTAEAADISAMHGLIGEHCKNHNSGQGARILYGGSVKPKNAREILALDGVDGALVGGASLTFEDFWAIIRAAA